MIEREIAPHLVRLFGQYPFVTVTGPRQSGKTTLCRSVFAGLDYANLEAPHVRDFAAADPRGFLAQFGDGAVLDEIHRVPGLLSYLQAQGDEEGRNAERSAEQFPAVEFALQLSSGAASLPPSQRPQSESPCRPKPALRDGFRPSAGRAATAGSHDQQVPPGDPRAVGLARR